MKNRLLLAAVSLVVACSASAAFYSETFTSDFESPWLIPDGNVNPWSDTRSVGGIPEGETITGVNVRLTVSGGFNGDLYGYVSYDGLLVPLLNRPGVGPANAFGYGDQGLDVMFTDAAANNIHFYQAVPGSSVDQGAAWQPDGRMLNPLTSLPSAYAAASDILGLGAFAGLSASGPWTVVLADLSLGGEARVESWGLDITTQSVPVPEAAQAGLWVALVCLVHFGFAMRERCLTRLPTDNTDTPPKSESPSHRRDIARYFLR